MIYLDYNATTPVLPDIFEAMRPFFCDEWANPSGAYPFSDKPTDAIEDSRFHVANLIGARPDEIFFTSGATESNQTILSGSTGRIVTSTVEHSSINEFAKDKKDTLFIPVHKNGQVDLDRLDSELAKNKASLASFIWANNETGVISPLQQISEICSNHGVLLHSDAVQAVGKIKIDVSGMAINYLSLSSHKIYGPKGIGAIYIRKGSPFQPVIIGSQERGNRGGTEAVPLIVGFGKAAELAKIELEKRTSQTRKMRDNLQQSILEQIPEAYINGDQENRLPNTLNIGIPSVDSDMVVQLLGRRGIMASNGSACKSQAITPSHVLIAMGLSYEKAGEALRFSVSHLTTALEIKVATSALSELVESVRL